MMNYFREGGFGMWLMLAGFLATIVIAAVRPRIARPGVFAVGTIAQLFLGILGMATGMMAVAHHIVQRNPDNAGIVVAQGLGELSNNGTFAVLLGTILGVASLVTGRAAAKE
jgi:hypothetical protein